jgi:hypothetical protein
MKRKAYSLLMIALFLAFSGPAGAFACASPCKMTQKQMLSCAKACAEEGQGAVLRTRPCVRFEARAGELLLAPIQAQAPAPAFSFILSSVQPASLDSAFLSTLAAFRGPPEASPAQAFLVSPSTHAPPALI